MAVSRWGRFAESHGTTKHSSRKKRYETPGYRVVGQGSSSSRHTRLLQKFIRYRRDGGLS
jgi:hypothetical protein